VPVQTDRKRENTMERQIAGSTLQKWESPTVTQIRVSAEVTAYAAIWRGAD
jgi:coenzyme PQQ precursor peptide PqqA